jgi:hypothetical protein
LEAAAELRATGVDALRGLGDGRWSGLVLLPELRDFLGVGEIGHHIPGGR